MAHFVTGFGEQLVVIWENQWKKGDRQIAVGKGGQALSTTKSDTPEIIPARRIPGGE
jgi:hypothetical protein